MMASAPASASFPVLPLRPERSLNALYEDAYDFTYRVWQEHPRFPESEIAHLEDCYHPPGDPMYSHFFALCGEFAAKWKQDPSNLDKAHDLIRATYTLGNGTMIHFAAEKSKELALKSCSYYYEKALLFLPVAYHLVRTQASHPELFYEKGTIQSEWRTLFHNLSDRLHALVPNLENDILLSLYYAAWFRKDETPATYLHQKSTLHLPRYFLTRFFQP